MKLPWIAAALVLSVTSPAFALAQADITPAALAGKTLTFNIGFGSAPFATTGSWTGTISSSGTGFSVANVTGNTTNITTTCESDNTDPSFTNYVLAKLVNGYGPAKITLYISSGVGQYELFIPGVNGTNQNGTFTVGATPPPVPGISIQKDGKSLTDGKSTEKFGSVKLGKKTSETYEIRNTGGANLTNIKVTLGGADAPSFKLVKPGKTKLTAGSKTSFTVTFKPTTKGKKTATLKVASSDANGTFDIKLSGKGTK